MSNFSHLVFNHIPKCAGSSLRQSLYNACSNHDYFSKVPIYISNYSHNNICLQENINLISAIHPETRLFFDHSHTYFFESNFNININSTYRILSIRNPITRLISHIKFFDNILITQCSYKTIKEKIMDYGNLTIKYLTLYKYNHQNLDTETLFNLAIDELSKYNFIFQKEKISTNIQEFNISNPFGLVLQEEYNNVSKTQEYEISNQKLSYIKSLLQFEILLLKNYYPDLL